VPDDLLRHLFCPRPYSTTWLWVAVLLTFAAIVWYAGLFVWTLSSQRLRRIPVVRRIHALLIRSRFARRVQGIADEHAAGRLSASSACAAINRTLRSFLHQATGARAQYLQVDAMADAGLAAAAPLIARLNDAQFNAEARVEMADISCRVQELIRSWT
jgi:hypothetical protein